MDVDFQKIESSMARISIVMATYNRAGFLREALQSMTQLNPPAYEIIVIDDGSTDDTASVLDEYSSHVISEKKSNAGKSSAINRAVSIASGDWIWICDDDDLVLPGAVGVFSGGISDCLDAGFVYSSYGWLVRDEEGQFQKMVPSVIDLPRSDEVWGCLLAGRWIPYMWSLVVRRDLFIKLGSLREDLRRVEDEEFALRLLRSSRGTPVLDKTYLFRQHDGVRGAGQFIFSNRNRESTDIAFLRAVYQGAYDEFDIDDYRVVAPNRYNLPVEPILMRLLTMFRVCLWENARIDFYISTSCKLRPRDIDDFSYCISLSISNFSLEKTRELMVSRFLVDLAGSEKGGEIRESLLRGLIRGLYWSIISDFKRRLFGDSVKRLGILLFLLRTLLRSMRFAKITVQR